MITFNFVVILIHRHRGKTELSLPKQEALIKICVPKRVLGNEKAFLIYLLMSADSDKEYSLDAFTIDKIENDPHIITNAASPGTL